MYKLYFEPSRITSYNVCYTKLLRALGTADLSVYEMVAAYATFANKGVYNKPVMVTRIEDKNGTILYQVTPESKDRNNFV